MHVPFLPTAVFVVVLGVPAPTGPAAEKLTDDEITVLLVGKWSSERKLDDGTIVKATDQFRKDGSYVGESLFQRGDKTLKVSVTGTWKIKAGVLEQTVETCDPPVLKKGQVATDQILSLNKKEMRIQPDNGKEITKTRLPE